MGTLYNSSRSESKSVEIPMTPAPIGRRKAEDKEKKKVLQIPRNEAVLTPPDVNYQPRRLKWTQSCPKIWTRFPTILIWKRIDFNFSFSYGLSRHSFAGPNNCWKKASFGKTSNDLNQDMQKYLRDVNQELKDLQNQLYALYNEVEELLIIVHQMKLMKTF